MSYNIEHYDYPESKSKSEIIDELNEYVKHRTWQEGGHGLDNEIRWLNKVCNTREEAEEYIQSEDDGWYDQIAVRYKEYPKGNYGKTIAALEAKREEYWNKFNAASREIHYANVKAELVTCRTCNSKIAKSYLRSNTCPVCMGDMRPESKLQEIARKKKAYYDLVDKIDKLKKKEDKKNKPQIRWLVKIEYHT